MNFNTVTVLGKELTSIEYNEQFLLTTAQLADFYDCEPRHIKQNFNNNRDRFVEGKHFFKLEGNELSTFKHEVDNFYLVDLQVEDIDLQNLRVTESYLQIPSKTRSLYLWTKRGAARHAKMLTTERAWDVFEELEDAYFDRLDYNDTTPGAPFWWEIKGKKHAKNSRPTKQITDFDRGIALSNLASHTTDLQVKEKLVTEAARLILGK